jgi:large subunit ribosomal protein L13
MAAKVFKTKNPSANDLQERWVHVDATGMRVGTLASKLAEILLDKSNVHMRAYLIPRVKLVVTNAAKIDATERRRISKLYTRYSGYPGGLTINTMDEILEKNPARAIELAVKGMLPKNRRGNAILANLYVYADTEHKHEGNQPVTVNVKEIKL